MRKITDEYISDFIKYLEEIERSSATQEKYLRDIKAFCSWVSDGEVVKQKIIAYKEYLLERYTAVSVNSMISSLNSFFSYLGWHEMRVRTIKVQKQMFSSEEKLLSKSEYNKLLTAARLNTDERMYLLIQTICATGIRVSELRYITVSAVNIGAAEINCKGRIRYAFIPQPLCAALKKYCQHQKIKSGSVFVTKNGTPLDRSNIWSNMKKLCEKAEVSPKKVFPHNLRHLFARTYYTSQKDIVKLADILGHANVNTTRIYTMESGETHREQIQQLGLLLC